MIIPTDRWEFFLRALREQVAEPSETHPTVRVWTASELATLISTIRQTHRAVLFTTFPTARAIIPHLQSIGWLHAIPVTAAKENPTFYLVDMEAAAKERVDPLELLQAARPAGVISYFGALSVYELTTQVPSFFHVGRLIAGAPPETELSAPPPAGRNPLGTELFRSNDTVCYETKRFRVLTPGIQLRTIGPRTWFRITTLEQTLLDTLLQPQRCGGEAVVMEVWDRARELCDWDRMSAHLAAIARDSLTRRVGAMLALLGIHKSGTALPSLLGEARARVGTTTPVIQLLPGLSFSALDVTWRVNIP